MINNYIKHKEAYNFFFHLISNLIINLDTGEYGLGYSTLVFFSDVYLIVFFGRRSEFINPQGYLKKSLFFIYCFTMAIV